MRGKTLVAGLGNIFLGDDGFGVEVASRLAREPLRDDVRVVDAGIRARDLAYELLDGGYDTAILVDAVSRGDTPGTVSLIEPVPSHAGGGAGKMAIDGHAMNPDTVLTFLQTLGGVPTRIWIVGCEPACIEEGVGLSQAATAAVEEALALVRELLEAPTRAGGECAEPAERERGTCV